MDQEVFLLDANVFVEAHRRYYAFDLVPRFWDAIAEQAGNGRVSSIDRVLAELVKGKDALADWGTKNDGIFASTDEADIAEWYANVMAWVVAQRQFSDAATAAFAAGADGWLVAFAKARRCTVVTHEQPSPDAKNRVPIPNVCRAFGVAFIDTFGMLRSLRVRLA